MTLLSALAGDAEIEALLSDAAQLTSMLDFERALAEASAEAGLISEDAATAIVSALGSFRPDWPGLEAGMAQDGVAVPALIKQLKAVLPEPYRAALHQGATSQDVTDTALMLQLAKVFDIYEARLTALLETLDALAAAHAPRPRFAPRAGSENLG